MSHNAPNHKGEAKKWRGKVLEWCAQCGGQRAFSRKTSLSIATVQSWILRERVPNKLTRAHVEMVTAVKGWEK